MKPYYQSDSATVYCADVLDALREMPDESVHCCVTSPPYWGLRDYGVEGQIGLEPNLQDYIAKMVEVFAEVRRVLRKDGTLWLNMGDCYNAGRDGGHPGGKAQWKPGEQKYANKSGANVNGLKPKDLVGLPWRVAFALQADGWWLRSDIIWSKPNPMPESVTDRPTRSHEYVFLLTKAARYFYDAEAIREKAKGPYTKMPDGWDTGKGAHGSFHRDGREKGKKIDKQRGHDRRHAGFNDRWDQMPKDEQQAGGANKRDVWSIAVQPFSAAHFATFPEKLVEPCVKAGCPASGTVLDPFAGSLTTGVVAVKLGRHFVGIELSQKYLDDFGLDRLRAAEQGLTVREVREGQQTIDFSGGDDG